MCDIANYCALILSTRSKRLKYAISMVIWNTLSVHGCFARFIKFVQIFLFVNIRNTFPLRKNIQQLSSQIYIMILFKAKFFQIISSEHIDCSK